MRMPLLLGSKVKEWVSHLAAPLVGTSFGSLCGRAFTDACWAMVSGRGLGQGYGGGGTARSAGRRRERGHAPEMSNEGGRRAEGCPRPRRCA